MQFPLPTLPAPHLPRKHWPGLGACVIASSPGARRLYVHNGRILLTRYLCLCLSPHTQKHGPRMKCSACKIIVHTSCLPIVMQRAQMACKPTFRDVGVRQYREQTTTHHHWVHRRTEKGKCQQCGKVRQWRRLISNNIWFCRIVCVIGWVFFFVLALAEWAKHHAGGCG